MTIPDLNQEEILHSEWIDIEIKDQVLKPIEWRETKDQYGDKSKDRITFLFQIQEGIHKGKRVKNAYWYAVESLSRLRNLYIACGLYTIEPTETGEPLIKVNSGIDGDSVIGKKFMADIVPSKDPKYFRIDKEKEIDGDIDQEPVKVSNEDIKELSDEIKESDVAVLAKTEPATTPADKMQQVKDSIKPKTEVPF